MKGGGGPSPQPPMGKERAEAFVALALEKKGWRMRLRMLPRNHWGEVVKLAGEAGYGFTIDELKAALPEGFFRGAGSDPELGWDRDAIFTDTENATAFVNLVRENKLLRLRLAMLPKNDWEGAVKVAKEAGFTLSVEDLQAAVPKEFFRGAGNHPEYGWDPPGDSDSTKDSSKGSGHL
jgi:hypothetical protein